MFIAISSITNTSMTEWSFGQKTFGQTLNISTTNHIYTETFYSDFSNIEVWFTNQNSMPPVIEDRINVTLVINDIGI